MHPYSAGYRTPSLRQNLILVLSALAGVIVSGIYIWATLPVTDVPPCPARGVVHQQPPLRTDVLIFVTLFFVATYATGRALYRFFGDAEGDLVVSATAGQHLPLLLLVAG